MSESALRKEVTQNQCSSKSRHVLVRGILYSPPTAVVLAKRINSITGTFLRHVLRF